MYKQFTPLSLCTIFYLLNKLICFVATPLSLYTIFLFTEYIFCCPPNSFSDVINVFKVFESLDSNLFVKDNCGKRAFTKNFEHVEGNTYNPSPQIVTNTIQHEDYAKLQIHMVAAKNRLGELKQLLLYIRCCVHVCVLLMFSQ